ncbi:MAG: proton-conducting transporter membrane subunit [candidate division WOR-3 bacterium]|nr:proton-conducting transporter membrane subunit [candidate division WOR-3 bacterium]
MIGLDFFVDHYGIFLSAIFVFIGLMSLIYGLATNREKGHRLEFYIMLFLIVGSGVGVALTYNLLLMYILWEISTFAVWRAVAYYRGDGEISAGTLTFLVNFAAATLMLIGFSILYMDNGTFNLPGIIVINDTAAILILIGILTKSVTIPLHIWLAPAYNAIPSAIGASLAGIAENLGAILFLRLFTMGNYAAPVFFNTVAWIAIISSIIGGGVALRVYKLRSLLAFSTISQLGFVILAFAVGGTYGILGGVLYIAAHALAKSGLFYGVGVIEDATGEDDMRNVACLLRLSPVLAVSMAMLVGSIVGFFPMLGFFSKLTVVIGAVEKTAYFGIGAIVAAIFTLLYNTRFYHELFFGERCDVYKLRAKRPSYTGVAVVFILAMVSLLLGIFFYQPVHYLTTGGL